MAKFVKNYQPWNKGKRKQYFCECGVSLRDPRSNRCRSCEAKRRWNSGVWNDKTILKMSKTWIKKGSPGLNKGKSNEKLRGENHPNWHGGIQKTGNYVQILDRNHKSCDSRGRILEHRYNMEKYLGRLLDNKEVVHHINKNTLDNSVNNLKLFTNQSSHLKEEWLIGTFGNR